MNTQNLENTRFNILRNALYHTARRRYLERYNRVFNFAIVVLGTAAVGDLLHQYELDARMLAAIMAVIGAMQLVFDFGRQARDHQALQREYYHLLADIEATASPSSDQEAKWYSRMMRITADETPVLKAIDAKSYNDAIDAFEYPRGERLKIPFLHRVFGSVLSFSGHHYKKVCELPGWNEGSNQN